MRRLLVLVLLVVTAAIASSCNAISVQDGVLNLDFNISQETVNSLIAATARSSADRGDDLLFDTVSGVELIEPDIIRVSGSGTADGSSYTGSYDLQIRSESGALRLAVTAVDVPGISLDDPRIVQTNADLTKAFSDQVVAERGQGVVSDVSVQDGELRLHIAAPLD